MRDSGGELVQRLPSHAQTAFGIAEEVRTLLLDVGRDAVDGLAGLLARVRESWGPRADAMLLRLTERLPATLADLVPTVAGPVPPGHAPRTPATFGAAKDLLYNRVYRGHARTFYCGCDFNRGGRTALDGCKLGAYAGNARAERVEAEHVFPAAQFGNYRSCWRHPEAFRACREADGDPVSGRACCRRVDEVFRAAHNDLHNLVPAVGMINGRRSDHNWGMVPGGEGYGACGMRIDAGGRRVQPPAAVRGDIARIMLYMQDTYGFRLSRQDQQLYAAWNNADPPDAWELERDGRIARLQGKGNWYVAGYRRL